MLRQIVLSVRNPVKSSHFFRDVLGVRIKHSTPDFVELDLSPPIVMTASDTSSTDLPPDSAGIGSGSNIGSSSAPILTFTVADMDACIPLALGLGGALDGKILRHAYGTVAAMRTPDGTLIGLFQPERAPAAPSGK